MPPRALSSEAFSVLICVAYCVSSSICVLHNKFLLSNYFPHENYLLLVQNLFTMLFIAAGRLMGSTTVTFELYRGRGRLSDWVIGVCYSCNVVCGMWALHYMSVPMFSALKRCNIVVVWIIEYVFSRKPTTVTSLRPIVVLLVGTTIAAHNDLEFHALGYLYGALSCVFQGSSFELGRRFVTSHQENGVGLWSVLMLNSMASTAVQVLYILLSGELLELSPFWRWDLSLWAHLLFNCVAIMGMNYVIFLNCFVNSPLSHAVTGNLKAVVTTVSGIVLFHTKVTGLGYLGLGTSFAGGALFSKVKYEESQRQRLRKKREEESLIV